VAPGAARALSISALQSNRVPMSNLESNQYIQYEKLEKNIKIVRDRYEPSFILSRDDYVSALNRANLLH
jgi:hypothetical protein